MKTSRKRSAPYGARKIQGIIYSKSKIFSNSEKQIGFLGVVQSGSIIIHMILCLRNRFQVFHGICHSIRSFFCSYLSIELNKNLTYFHTMTLCTLRTIVGSLLLLHFGNFEDIGRRESNTE